MARAEVDARVAAAAIVGLERSNRSNLRRYSCIDAWYDGGGGLYWNSGYIMAENGNKLNEYP